MRFRCYKCNPPFGFEFEADGPQCPSCNRVGGQTVIPLVDVHWLGPTPGGPILGHYGDQLAIACMPKRPNVFGVHATGELTATTCPACRQSELFRAAWEEWAGIFPDLAKAWQIRQTVKA